MIYEVLSFYEANPIIPNFIERQKLVEFKQQRKNTVRDILVVNNPYFAEQFYTKNFDLQIKNFAGDIILLCPLAYFVKSTPQGKNINSDEFNDLELVNVDWLKSGIILNNNITFDLFFGGTNTTPYFTLSIKH